MKLVSGLPVSFAAEHLAIVGELSNISISYDEQGKEGWDIIPS